jgi:predicted esterase
VCLLLLGGALLAAPHAVAQAPTSAAREAPVLGRTIPVPFDHLHPELGTFPLYYELGAPFAPTKTTVLVIADGQQFYLQKGSVAQLQKERFGDRFNVVGIVGRSANPDLQQWLTKHEPVDWKLVYQVLQSAQWIEDIEVVRKAMVGATGSVVLYGASGGAMLVAESLAKHSQYVLRALVESSVSPFVEAEYGLHSDRFWEEIGAYDRSLQKELLDVLARHAKERSDIITVLQRQNFFVPREQLQKERARIIHALHDGDRALFEKLKIDYQVLAINEMFASPLGMGARVREYEMSAPRLDRDPAVQTDHVDPDLEAAYRFAEPLFLLLRRGELPRPGMELAALHRVATEVYLVAGRYDHTVDYRSQIGLASYFAKHRLLLLDDDHIFHHLKASGLRSPLTQAVLLYGIFSPEVKALEGRMNFLWRE